ncbi:MAG: DUF4397 domain-containing protein, partial [Chloroflexaceae bacterium]|nr:DUF4397 domain-containing protein [Chloroflexaceae bacterium]
MNLRLVSLLVIITMLVSTIAVSSPFTVPTQAAVLGTAATLPVPQQAIQPVAPDAEAAADLQTTASITPTASLALRPIGTYRGAGAEITAFDPGSQRLFTTDAGNNKIDIIDASDLTNLRLISSIDTTTVAPYGGSPNSVAVANGIVAIAVEDASDKTAPGSVLFYDVNGTLLNAVQAGALPDMVTFNRDGTKVLVANEGEANSDLTKNPEGSVTIIDVPATLTTADVLAATTVDFTAFNRGGPRFAEAVAANIRISSPSGFSIAQELEPEYITVSPDNTKAYVSLQENNAVAIIDIATGTVDALAGLGWKNHNMPGNELDASDRDNTINIRNWPVRGMYQPDAIASFTVGGETYVVSANEGDSRSGDDYSGFNEEVRIGDLFLDTTVFTDATIQENANLGRLRVTNTPGFLGRAKLRVVHASPDSPNVDVYLTPAADAVYTQTRVLENVPFFTISNYLSVMPGAYNYSVTPTDAPNTPLLSGTVMLNGGEAYTLAATDFLANITARTFMDNIAGAAADNAKVRVYHLSPDAPAVDVVANGVLSPVTGLTFGNASTYFQVAEGTYDLQVKVSGTDTVAIDLPGTEMKADQVYSVFAYNRVVSITAALEPLRFRELYSYGARSFTIWNSAGELVYDSGNLFAQIIAGINPTNFNGQYDDGDANAFDVRSDDKASEPEAVTTGVVNGRTYAFVGLERQGGIMVYDVTTPTAPTFVQYVNNTDFEGTIEDGTVGD